MQSEYCVNLGLSVLPSTNKSTFIYLQWGFWGKFLLFQETFLIVWFYSNDLIMTHKQELHCSLFINASILGNSGFSDYKTTLSSSWVEIFYHHRRVFVARRSSACKPRPLLILGLIPCHPKDFCHGNLLGIVLLPLSWMLCSFIRNNHTL